MTQRASDIFLGWTSASTLHVDFYVRQLRDMKVKPLVEGMTPPLLVDYAVLCGWTLARAHAKSGDAVKIAAYLGKKPTFDGALADFSEAYVTKMSGITPRS